MITMNDVLLEYVHLYNYLGVLIYNMLSFRRLHFVDDEYNKVNYRVYQLRRIRTYLNSDIVCLAIHGLCRFYD